MRGTRIRAAATIVILLLASLATLPARADPPGNTFFDRTWERTDYPVAEGQVTRTWMWGPEAFTPQGQELYTESPGGWRTVQYFDKSRMEITDPGGDDSSPWFVTNGLLVVEMVRGYIQWGDDDFTVNLEGPAQINVAGDADDPTGPTYATFTDHIHDPPQDPGTLITRRINRVGTVTHDSSLVDYNVSAGFLDIVTDHTVAAPFWDFMNSTGLVYEDGAYADDDLFLNPFYATGRPITEAYWANVKVADTYQDVLMQCFERRCLTYTPGNAPEWQVEAGNVGRHFYSWVYGEFENTPPSPGLLIYQSEYENWTEWPAVDDPTDSRIIGDPDGEASRCGDHFCVTIPGGSNIWAAAGGYLPDYDDAAVLGAVHLTNAGPGDRGCVMARVVESYGLLQLYAFCVTGLDEVIAFYYEETPAGPTATWLIPPGEVNSERPADDWNTLWITARGHDIWFFNNGILAGEATHTEGPLAGAAAVGAQRLAAGPDPLTAEFASLWVHAID